MLHRDITENAQQYNYQISELKYQILHFLFAFYVINFFFFFFLNFFFEIIFILSFFFNYFRPWSNF